MQKKELKNLSLDEYDRLREMGFLWEFYPQATGNYNQDCPQYKEEQNR